MKIKTLVSLLAMPSLLGGLLTAAPLGTVFTYQGRLNDGPNPAGGSYDFRFAIYEAAESGAQLGLMLTNAAITVSNGLFTIALDFGEGVFTGDARWLEIGVRTNGSPADFTTLSPRQPLTPSPYALYAPGAGTAGSAAAVTGPIAASQLTGTIAPTNIAPGTISGAMLATGSVTTAALADGAVTLAKLQTANTSHFVTVIPNPTPADGDNFGFAMAPVGGDRVLIGAPFDDLGTNDSGAAYLFTLNGVLLTTFTNPVPGMSDSFGRAVAAVGANRVLIGCTGADYGATGAGTAYLYDLNGTLVTTFTNPTPASSDYFGGAAAAVGEAHVLIGAFGDDTASPSAGAAYLFNTNGTLVTTFTNPVLGSVSGFGWSVAGVGADTVLIGVNYEPTPGISSPIAFLFNTNGTRLLTITHPTPGSGDYFGASVAWAGGDRFLIGALGADLANAYLYDVSGRLLGAYTNPFPPLEEEEDFGKALAAVGPDKVLIGIPGDSTAGTGAGMACLFSTGGGLLATYTNPAPSMYESFGCSVAAADANTLLIGASAGKVGGIRAGAVYVFSLVSYLPGLAGHGAVPASITTPMLATGSVTAAQLAPGSVTTAALAPASVTPAQLSPGAAFTNLYAGGQSGVAGGGIVLSEQFDNTNLIQAGYVKIGKVELVAEQWRTNAAGPPTTGILSRGRTGHAAVWTGSEMLIWGGSDGDTALNDGLRYNPAANTWTEMTKANAPSPRWGYSVVWTGSRMIIWGGGGSPNELDSGALYNPAANTWTPTSLTGAPSPRNSHSAVWTGSEMIIWGGKGFHIAGLWSLASGGRYNPTADTWTDLNYSGHPEDRYAHCAVWTGTEMIVWGGESMRGCGAFCAYPLPVQTGGRYNPTTDSWTATSTNGAPTARVGATAVWSGSQMLVWGGRDDSGIVNTGGRYNPGSDTWSAMATAGAPIPRSGFTGTWGGNRLIVWGGLNLADNPVNSGGRYDPVANTWTTTTTAGAPSARQRHSAVWTGSQMIVWGGDDHGTPKTCFDSGGRYDVTNNVWTTMALPPATGEPGERAYASALWTGSEMIVWGGESAGVQLRTGGRYNPAANTWTTTSTSNSPSGRKRHSAVWTGSEMIVWGGYDGDLTSTGARYNPVLNTWAPVQSSNAPAARQLHGAVWTGSEMLIWGGFKPAHPIPDHYNDGARYHAASNTWTAMSTNGAPAGRTGPTAAWTGSEMIIWGGWDDSGELNTGARYQPANEGTGASPWSPLPTNNAPTYRSGCATLWTGKELIVWGGFDGVANVNTGARFNPLLNAWIIMSTTGAPPGRQNATAVWDGTHMLVWGGWAAGQSLNDGKRYDPITDAWAPLAYVSSIAGRSHHTAVWTGTEMIICDGENDTTYLDSCYSYTPPRTIYLYLKP